MKDKKFEKFKKELDFILAEVFSLHNEYNDDSFNAIWLEENQGKIPWVEFDFNEDLPDVAAIRQMTAHVIRQLANIHGYIAVTRSEGL